MTTMTPTLRSKSRSFFGLQGLVVGLFLVLQAFLLAHHFEHGLHPDLIGASDDCVLCQVSATQLPAPEPATVIVPVAIVDRPALPFVTQISATAYAVAGFRSRAPPRAFSA
jgi:hypothetical protein